ENITCEPYDLCVHCGYTMRAGSSRGACHCEQGSDSYVRVHKITTANTTENSKRPLVKCVSCENSHPFGILRTFFTGQEAVTSVIGTALFEELPSYQLKRELVE